jgi:hypothetical protein
MHWKTDAHGAFFRTCWLFLTLSAFLGIIFFYGMEIPEPLASRTMVYVIGVALLIYYHSHAVLSRFRGFVFNVVACWLAAIALADIWFNSGRLFQRDVMLISISALLLIPSILIQFRVLGPSLLTRKALRNLLLPVGVLVVVVVLALLISFAIGN